MNRSVCFNFQERVMPHLRAETARRLLQNGLRQSRVAEHLGVSQAMVSKYLRTTMEAPRGANRAWLQTAIDRAVASILEDEAKGRVPAWCSLCPSALPPTGSTGLDECLRGDGLPARDASQAVLDNLAQAARRLQGRTLAPLAPEVNVNLAMCLPEAHDSRGVAAFPGRFVEVRGELRPVSDAEFGASHHLSQILLRVRRNAPHVRAILCLRDSEEVRRAIRAAQLRYRLLRRSRGELVVQLPAREPADALIDAGDFGIEPITYILGETALDAVEKAERLIPLLEAQPSPA